MDLPAEVQDNIIKNLNAPSPLFRPVYGKDFSNGQLSRYGDLERKHRLYWGAPREPEQNEAVMTLLNLAHTCRTYEKLLAPTIYETLVLRPTPESLATVREIQRSDKWSLVKHLIVCGVYMVAEGNDRVRKETAPKDLQAYHEQMLIEEGLLLAKNDASSDPSRNLYDAKDRFKKATDAGHKAANKSKVKPGSQKPYPTPAGESGDIWSSFWNPSEKIDFKLLADILENLPPNLQSLTIDTPTDWLDTFGGDGDYLEVFIHETAEQILENEKSNVYRKQFHAILTSVCSDKNLETLKRCSESDAGFTLRLLSVPPFSSSMFPGALEYPCAKKEEEGEAETTTAGDEPTPESRGSNTRLPELLSLVSSFTISFVWWDNGACWHMNSNPFVDSFAASLPTFLFNHLSDKCHTFKFEGDKSWILGDQRSSYSSMNTLPLDTESHTVSSDFEERHIKIPGFQPQACAKIKNLEISNCFIGREILNFVSARKSSVEHIKLYNCWGQSADSTHEENDDDDRRTWAGFLAALAKMKCPKLARVEVSYDPEESKSIIDRNAEHEKDLEFMTNRTFVYFSTDISAEDDGVGSASGNEQEVDKKSFGYGQIDDKYGDLYVDEELCKQRSEEGEDWKAWLKLVKPVQKRKSGRVK